MRRQALDDQAIKHILNLLDKKEYTQQEIAEKYGVTQGTISRYNRVKRLQFKVEDDSKLIARLNLEIYDLKQKLGLDTSEETSIPDSFMISSLLLKIDPKTNQKIKAFFSKDHFDCIQFINRHPEYKMYTMVTNPKIKEFSIPQFLRSRANKNVYGYIIAREDLGKLTASNQIQIRLFELNK